MLNLIDKHQGDFKIAYSLSGVLMEQLELYRPDVLKSFQALAKTGCVEFLSETYHHSLSYLYSKEELSGRLICIKSKSKNISIKRQRFSETPSSFIIMR